MRFAERWANPASRRCGILCSMCGIRSVASPNFSSVVRHRSKYAAESKRAHPYFNVILAGWWHHMRAPAGWLDRAAPTPRVLPSDSWLLHWHHQMLLFVHDMF
jgi:hypothetical protein